MNAINRRRFERFALPAGYTPVAVRLVADSTYRFEGHAYDVSEAGIRFELDQPIDPGTPVAIEFTLPSGATNRPAQSVCAIANVVWAADDADEHGPVKMAAEFTRFARPLDKARLIDQLGAGRLQRAA